MKTIICGLCTSKKDDVFAAIKSAIKQGAVITEVVIMPQMYPGGNTDESGPEVYGAEWAIYNGIPIKMFPVWWEKDRFDAQDICNEQAVAYADQCIALWDGKEKHIGRLLSVALDNRKKVFSFQQYHILDRFFLMDINGLNAVVKYEQSSDGFISCLIDFPEIQFEHEQKPFIEINGEAEGKSPTPLISMRLSTYTMDDYFNQKSYITEQLDTPFIKQQLKLMTDIIKDDLRFSKSNSAI